MNKNVQLFFNYTNSHTLNNNVNFPHFVNECMYVCSEQIITKKNHL